MGSTSTKSATSEKKKKIPLTIYTCGNKEEIKKFNNIEIRKDNYMELELNEEKHKKFDWYFNYNHTEINEDSITKIMNKICSEYKNRKNFNNNNNILLIFMDSQEKINENKEKIRIIFEKLDKVYKIYKPIIILAFKDNKNSMDIEGNHEESEESLIDTVIKENKYDNYFTRKYIEIVHYKENYYIEIMRKIYSIDCYYNNIGDIFSIVDEMIKLYDLNNCKIRNKTKFDATFNILILGRPGCGKSTLINLLLNKRKAREGIGDSITKVVSKYVHDKYPITFEDTPGFENDDDLKKMIKFLNDYNDIFSGGKNQFHLVLYLINSSNARTFMGEEIKLIDFIEKKMRIPIFFVCTRSKNKDNAKNFEEVVRVNLWQNFGENTHLVDHIYCCHLLNEEDGVYKKFGIDELLEGIKNYFYKEIERKENELFMNEKGEKEEINSEKELDFENLSKECIFLSDLKRPEDFGDYLNDISSKIISNYENFTYLEEKEKKEKKGKKEKNNNNDNNDNNNNKIYNINELLVNHLALELNGKSTGNVFCKKNYDQIIDNLDNYQSSYFCFPKTTDENIKGNLINDEDLKRPIRITREFGLEAKKQFLNDLRNEYGFEEYLKSLIDNYKIAIQSLTNLDKIIE